MRKCYISKNYKSVNGAGNKAKTDIEFILEKDGFINLGLKSSQKSNMVQDYLYTLTSVFKAVIAMRKEDIVLIQYPWKKYFDFICRKAHAKGAKVITLIHDLGSFRRHKLTIEQEIIRLNQSDCIIAHNPNMKDWLIEHGVNCPIVCLGIFDYLSDANPSTLELTTDEYRIAYAGALSPKKNKFLYELFSKEQPYTMELFGNGFEQNAEDIKILLNYHGFTPSDTLISSVQAHFGLVWDGDRIDECSGVYGVYLRYNNPHKTSLYLRSHLPVIIWSESALAPLITEYKAGICVKSLDELPEILASLSHKDYLQLKANATKLGNLIAKGYHVKTASEKAIEILSK